MKVLARFPALDTVPATACTADGGVDAAAMPDGAAGRPRVATETRRRRTRERFPGGSVAVLALMAAIVWSLASWNDACRLERSRQERLAAGRIPAAAPGTVAR